MEEHHKMIPRDTENGRISDAVTFVDNTLRTIPEGYSLFRYRDNIYGTTKTCSTRGEA